MRVHLFAFGKLKTAGLRETADYYLKILRPWVEVAEIELKPLPVPDKSAATRFKIQEQEEKALLAKLPPRAALYLLDERGKATPTLDWAHRVREWEGGGGDVALAIGSSLGFSDALRTRARGLVSLGPQTFSHELARVVLLEQLYRAWSVTRGHPYHNEK